MIKAIELIIVITLLIFSFFAGVKYSDVVRSHASWIFENKDEEVELPDLSNENSGGDIGATIDENGENLGGGNMMDNSGNLQDSVPMDDINQAPQAAPATVSQ